MKFVARFFKRIILIPVKAGKSNPVPSRQFGAYKGKITIDARFDEPLPDDELNDWAL